MSTVIILYAQCRHYNTFRAKIMMFLKKIIVKKHQGYVLARYIIFSRPLVVFNWENGPYLTK